MHYGRIHQNRIRARIDAVRLSPDRDWLLSIAGLSLVARAVTIAALGVAAARAGHPLSWATTNFDGAWYARLVQQGYPTALPTYPDGTIFASTAAFFPLFALLIRPFTAIGLPFWWAALLWVTVLAAVASVLIALVVRRYASDRVAFITAACWAVFPTSGLLSVAYSEALFTALAAGCLLCLSQRSWTAAGLLAALSGATRPTGVIVVAAVGVAVLVALFRDDDRRSLVAALLAPWGTIGSLLWIGVRAGRLDAWFVTENQGWGVHFDGGWTLLTWCIDAVLGRHGVVGILYVLVLVGVLVLAVIAALQRPPPAVLTYLVLGTVLAVGQGGTFHLSGLRFLLPIFPLLVPAARFLTARSRSSIAVALTGAGLLSAGLACYYFTIGTAPP